MISQKVYTSIYQYILVYTFDPFIYYCTGFQMRARPETNELEAGPAGYSAGDDYRARPRTTVPAQRRQGPQRGLPLRCASGILTT